MRRRKLRTNAAARASLRLLRILFKEAQCEITDVAWRFRRNRFDFIAVPQLAASCFVVVRPERDGSISIRPFANLSEARGRIERLTKKVPPLVRWQEKPLVFIHPPNWMLLIDRVGRQHLREQLYART